MTKYEGHILTVENAHAAYLRYCRGRGWMPRRQRDYAHELEEAILYAHDTPKAHDLGSRAWRGLSLKSDATDASQPIPSIGTNLFPPQSTGKEASETSGQGGNQC